MVDKHPGQRFLFGENWNSFLHRVDETIITRAEDSIKKALNVYSLEGKSFLDAGCGSGLFSLAALRLGAKRVHSFDYDNSSVACTKELKRRYAPSSSEWSIETGDALDANYLRSLDGYHIVYSWGVLHHTGDLWRGLENITIPLVKRGQLYIAIYNDQGFASRIWRGIKKTYNDLPAALRFLIVWPAIAWLWGPRTITDLLQGRPFYSWNTYNLKNRGMSAWHDVVDWVGGYPFEVARPEEIFHFYQVRGFELQVLKTVGGKLGCNEFVFTKK